MNTFCTIITSSHLPYACALFDSLRQYDKCISFNVLVVDDENTETDETEGMLFHSLENIANRSAVGKQICNSYDKPDMQDKLRWSLKPVFINYLFDQGY